MDVIDTGPWNRVVKIHALITASSWLYQYLKNYEWYLNNGTIYGSKQLNISIGPGALLIVLSFLRQEIDNSFLRVITYLQDVTKQELTTKE